MLRRSASRVDRSAAEERSFRKSIVRKAVHSAHVGEKGLSPGCLHLPFKGLRRLTKSLPVNIPDRKCTNTSRGPIQEPTRSQRSDFRRSTSQSEISEIDRQTALEFSGGVNDEVGCMQSELRTALIAAYQRDKFTWIESFITERKYVHVSCLEFHLTVVHDLTCFDLKDKQLQQVSPEIHLQSRHVKKFCIDDLFQQRDVDSDHTIRLIRRILVTGKVGDGKTSLARKLAYDWSVGSWGTEFSSVFVLGVKKLSKRYYDNAHVFRTNTLASAIVNECFPPLDQPVFESLCHAVTRELEKPDMLVILDGLEDVSDASPEILSEIENGPFKLLMLSRPVGAQNERFAADLEIQMLELKDSQILSHIKNQGLASQERDVLFHMQGCPAIWGIIHIPVYLHAFCEMWKLRRGSITSFLKKSSLVWIYKRFAELVRRRYMVERRFGLPHSREALFECLGHLALDSTLNRRACIGPQDLELSTEDEVMHQILGDSGLLTQDECGNCEFPHKTLQEYFAGTETAKNLFSDRDDVRNAAENVIRTEKYNSEYRLIFIFVAGIVADEKGQEGIRHLLRLVEEGGIEVSGVHHLKLEVELLQSWLCDGFADEEDFTSIDAEFKISKSLKKLLKKGLKMARPQKDKPEGEDALLDVMVRMLKSCPEVTRRVPGLLDIVLSEMKAMRWDVDKVVFEALAEIANAGRSLEKLEASLGAACQHTSGNVRRAATDGLRLIVRHSKESIPAVLGILKSIPDNKEAKAWVFIEIVKQCPERIGEVVDEIAEAADCDGYWIRKFTVAAISDASKESPQDVAPLVGSLLNKCNQSEHAISIGTVEIFGVSVRACPDEKDEILDLLLSTLAVQDEDLNEAAAGSVAEVIRAFPDCVPRVIQTLLDQINEETWATRYPYIRAAIGTIPDVPHIHVPQMMDALLELDVMRYPGVQVIVLEAAANLSKISSDQLSRVLPSAMKCYKDPTWQVRHLAIHSMGLIVMDALDSVPWMLDGLKKVLIDQAYKVRCAAMVTASQIMQASPEHASDLVSILMEGIDDEDDDVRKLAGEGIKKMIVKGPDGEQLLKALIEKYSQDASASTRHGVVHALLSIIEALPHHIPDVVDILKHASIDRDENVRRGAIEGLGIVARSSEASSLLALVLLKEACQSDCRATRFCAISVLTDVVADNNSHADHLIEALIQEITCSNMREWRVYLRSVSVVLDTNTPDSFGFVPLLVGQSRRELSEIQTLRNQIIREKSLKQIFFWYSVTQLDSLIRHILFKLVSTKLWLADSTNPKFQIFKWHEANGVLETIEFPKKMALKLLKKIKHQAASAHGHTMDRIASCMPFNSFSVF